MLTTRIELVTSSLPMRCATDCAMSAYLLKLIVSLLTINFKSQTNTQCLSSITVTYSICNTKCSSSITIILPSHKMHRFTINIQSESVRQIFHICLALHTSCAELFYPISPRKATFRMKDMATPFVQQPSPYCQSEALFHSCQE